MSADVAERRGGDLLRTYVWLMGLVAVVLGAAWLWLASQRDEYVTALEDAPAIFGSGAVRPLAEKQTPTTIRQLALAVQKYLETYRAARVKPDDAVKIPIQLVSDRASSAGMKLLRTPTEQQNPVKNRGYEEIYADFTFEATDLGHLTEFLYNFEMNTTKYRVIELKWKLKGEKENPYQPGSLYGNLVDGPTVRIGFRRPLRATRTSP